MKGIGYQSASAALDGLHNMTSDINAIPKQEYLQRMEKAQRYMQEHGIDAIYLNAGTNLKYFTGLKWYASERLVGAILPANGELQFIVPHFEIGSIKDYWLIEAPIHHWHEEECPYQLVAEVIRTLNIRANATLGIDESAAFFVADGIKQAAPDLNIVNAKPVTAHCRMHKSENEIALIQRAMDMTLEVHKATASMLYEGITTTEVEQFIDQAHKKVGASGSYFKIVLFGVASSFPHGVKNPQVLKQGDVVLIDTGCQLEGYLSDITRTYVFGQPSERQKLMWQYEKNAQLAAFEAAKIGATCGDVDYAARSYLAAQQLGPDYQLPGCPHRTGHGIGLDIHEWPYLVKDNPQPLGEGMCFSNEPMLVIPNEFGIRLEDHFYVTADGPKWFTEPAHSIDNPFGL
ncbi:M24 family metallopeptidase [Pseudoalteromonas sp. T1lg65]|uniref:M24 family metallopeptidase n=1 Tax=Pseudoalteromonas sp. T1lg65 TaxID=2077101 RepID=UPI003F7B0120